MKKLTKDSLKKAVNKGTLAAQKVAREVSASAFVMGRGIMRGVKQGMDDVKKLDKRAKHKS